MKYSRLIQASTLSLFVITSLLFLAESCGQKGGSGSSSQNASDHKSIAIPLSVTDTDSTSLALAAPGGVNGTSIALTLTGCSSGLTGSNSSQTVMNVYLFDTNCLAKLTNFTANGIAYASTGGGSSPFTTWLAGDTAIFVNGANTVNVKVVAQLSSPIQVTDTISYNFTFIKTGTNSSTITVSEAQSLFVAGTDAPNFKINSGGATLVGVVPTGLSQGDGQFTFQVLCNTGAMTAGQGADSGFNSFCPDTTAGGLFAGGATGVDIGSTYFSYKLIIDPNGNGTLTLAQAQSAMALGGDSTNALPGSIIGGSTGFNSVTLTPVTLAGSTAVPIASNPKMILILQAKNTAAAFATNTNYSSFQYFPITLPTVTP